MQETFTSLQEIENLCWSYLEAGTKSFKNDFHLAIIATVDKTNKPALRTMVLRKVSSTEKKLFFHTDIRTGKITGLTENPLMSCLFYSKNQREQIRLNGTATVHTSDEIANGAWRNTKLSSKKNYLATPAPGSPATTFTSGLPAGLEERDPSVPESEAGRKNFAVIEMQAETMEWLWLSHKGNRRACFNYKKDKTDSTWLIP